MTVCPSINSILHGIKSSYNPQSIPSAKRSLFDMELSSDRGEFTSDG